MQLAMVAAGFTPGEADQLRRSMAAWKRKGGLEQFEQRLIDGMLDARLYSANSPSRSSARSWASANTAFPNRTRRASRCSPMSRRGSSATSRRHFSPRCSTASRWAFTRPSQLVQDARRHGVEVRPADVHVSDWDCTLEPDARRQAGGAPGFRPHDRLGGKIGASGSSLRASDAQIRYRLTISRGARGSIARDLKRSPAPARSPHWPGTGAWRAGRSPASSRPRVCSSQRRASIRCPRSRRRTKAKTWSPIMRAPGLTLGRHPLALLRSRLRRLRLSTAAELNQFPHGRLARAAGIVTGRQRPGTASGVVFVTLEDETGNINVVVWNEPGRKTAPRIAGLELIGRLWGSRAAGRSRPSHRAAARRLQRALGTAGNHQPGLSLSARRGRFRRLSRSDAGASFMPRSWLIA